MAGEVFSNLITSVNPKAMNSGSRQGIKIDRIILHHNATTNKDVAMNTWVQGGAAGTSAHYEITPTEIIGCVGEQYAAWHAGGTGPADPPRITNPNYRSIGLENLNSTGAPNWLLDPRTIKNCARLVADICKRYNIPCDRKHVLGHNEVTSTACPGGMNVDEVVRQARAILNGSSNDNSISDTKPTNKNKGVATMYALYEHDGKWYFYNGVTYEYVGHPDALVIIKEVYRKNNGKEIPEFHWKKGAPWWSRLEQPVVDLQKLSDTVAKIAKKVGV
ncbi:peptidoglycan recognition protein family protein [Enterococcus dongliensis]|uniref:N-acetylmuramoyl-L-alanine amidase n=1 Tax=Enterococcus dongliensis TaxID=2559925 RepID=A0ABU3ER42_9ENTE|nr:peptidoglycan recognition family protein [Enterococcus dongliensis]MDT2596793.1 peptidoglycan recognition family protein [Enterococcus dongliensis]MDT2646465.1 peptidoglycan recognition family protein [Enterococcus dongliensis]